MSIDDIVPITEIKSHVFANHYPSIGRFFWDITRFNTIETFSLLANI